MCWGSTAVLSFMHSLTHPSTHHSCIYLPSIHPFTHPPNHPFTQWADVEFLSIRCHRQNPAQTRAVLSGRSHPWEVRPHSGYWMISLVCADECAGPEPPLLGTDGAGYRRKRRLPVSWGAGLSDTGSCVSNVTWEPPGVMDSRPGAPAGLLPASHL